MRNTNGTNRSVIEGNVTMRDSDFWYRDYRRHSMRGRSFWGDHAEAMELLVLGNQILAQEIVDRLGRLWRNLRQRVVASAHNAGRDMRLP
jgi:hypothetical protein